MTGSTGAHSVPTFRLLKFCQDIINAIIDPIFIKVGWPNGKALDYDSEWLIHQCPIKRLQVRSLRRSVHAIQSYNGLSNTFAHRLALICVFLTFFDVSWTRTIMAAVPFDQRHYQLTIYRCSVSLPQKETTPMEYRFLGVEIIKSTSRKR